MSDDLRSAALELPLCDRIALAEALWESIEFDQMETDAEKARTALQRHAESDPDMDEVPSIQEAIQAARRITGCA